MNSNCMDLINNYEISSQFYTHSSPKPSQYLESQTYLQKQQEKGGSSHKTEQSPAQKKRKLNDDEQILMNELASVHSEIKRHWKAPKDIPPDEILEGVDILQWHDLVISMRKFQTGLRPVESLIYPENEETLIDISNFASNDSSISVTAEETLLFDQMLQNPSPQDIFLNCFNTTFIIPKYSTFMMSVTLDVKLFTMSGQPTDGYHIILMDPPWENISASRANKYNTLPNYELFKIPMSKLSNKSGTLVAVWVTNKPKYFKFVIESLFPKWNAQHVATWHWLKMTSSGELVAPLDSAHRKPYEPLLLGFIPAANQNSTDNKLKDKVIASVVSAHSRKPLIHDLLRSLYRTLTNCNTENLNCLEMFARNLVPHWTSWGNQVLHFQHIDFFTVGNKKEEQKS